MNNCRILPYLCFTLLLFMYNHVASEEMNCQLLLDVHDRAAALLSRNFLFGKSNRWPHGVVPYTISSNFTARQRNVIINSIQEVNSKTCIQFVPRSNETTFLEIITGGSGCFAHLGFNNKRNQSVLHLAAVGCIFPGIIFHELMHTLGFLHEHTRPDRDQYVQIHWENIQNGSHVNFWRQLDEKKSTTLPYCGNVGLEEYNSCHGGIRVSTFGKAYDYESVTHYSLKAFSKNDLNTITPKMPTNIDIGLGFSMSKLDIEKVHAAYGCADPITKDPVISTTTGCVDTISDCSQFTELCRFHPAISKGCQKTCFNCECKNKLEDDICTRIKEHCDFPFVTEFCDKECRGC